MRPETSLLSRQFDVECFEMGSSIAPSVYDYDERSSDMV